MSLSSTNKKKNNYTLVYVVYICGYVSDANSQPCLLRNTEYAQDCNKSQTSHSRLSKKIRVFFIPVIILLILLPLIIC